MLNSGIHTQTQRLTHTQIHPHGHTQIPPLLFGEVTAKAFWKNQDTFPFKHLSLGFVHKTGNQEGIKENIQVVLEVAHREETRIRVSS